MTKPLSLPHTQIDANGRWRYRRRVPDRLRRALGKREFIKVLGASDADAMRNFGPYHRHVEDTLAHGRPLGGTDTFLDARQRAMAFVREMGWDPNRGCNEVDEEEAEVRQFAVGHILDNYIPDRDTGVPRPEDVSDHDNVMITTLLQGAGKVTMTPTVSEAFDLYLREKVNPDPHKRRKQVERYRRAERNAILAFGGNIRLTDIKRRPHANDLRDLLLERMQVASAKRQINDVKAVLNFAAREFEVEYQDRFSRLNWPTTNEPDRDKRHPLPPDVIRAMYADLARNRRVLLHLWTLLHHTGAQGAEVLGLKVGEFRLDAEVPHIVIRPRGERSVKDGWRMRDVPLVGEALTAARAVTEGRGPEEDAFPRYAATSKHGAFSQTMNKRLRKFTTDRRHTIYSLRHTMKDALREARVGQGLENAILGHALSGGVDANYGRGYSLAAKRDALRNAQGTSESGTVLPPEIVAHAGQERE